ncbi:MAG: DUF3604 domain-containing protein, partial [Gemmatimonadales bacterium]|nr:DUF3604 domain-containing protein [Gemmatimonadales bacterium]
MRSTPIGLSLLVLAACGRPEQPSTSPADAGAAPTAATVPSNPDRNAYFGAVHVHTTISFDAFTNGTRTTPEDAYRWARGETISSSGMGDSLKARTPLDFYAVTDHAEMLG